MTSAKRYKLRGSAVLALALLVFSVAAVGVHAYEPCQRFVQTYVEKVVKHHYSKATLARWADWGKAHPNYHPPKRRPHLGPKETLEKVNFDCQVPEQNQQIGALLDLEPIPDELPLIPELVAVNTAPPLVPRTVSLVALPVVDNPVVASLDTPEPHTWVLGITGMAFLLLALGMRWSHRSGQPDLSLPTSAL